jgi:hypothetical protein
MAPKHVTPFGGIDLQLSPYRSGGTWRSGCLCNIWLGLGGCIHPCLAKYVTGRVSGKGEANSHWQSWVRSVTLPMYVSRKLFFSCNQLVAVVMLHFLLTSRYVAGSIQSQVRPCGTYISAIINICNGLNEVQKVEAFFLLVSVYLSAAFHQIQYSRCINLIALSMDMSQSS